MGIIPTQQHSIPTNRHSVNHFPKKNHTGRRMALDKLLRGVFAMCGLEAHAQGVSVSRIVRPFPAPPPYPHPTHSNDPGLCAAVATVHAGVRAARGRAATEPGHRSPEQGMAELPTDRDPTVWEINAELIETATWFEDATFVLGRGGPG